MYRICWRLSVIALLIATLAFITTAYVDSDWNVEPLHIPLPGPGLEVDSGFHVVTGGTFVLVAETPMSAREKTQVAMADLPPVQCSLDLQVTSRSGFN